MVRSDRRRVSVGEGVYLLRYSATKAAGRLPVARIEAGGDRAVTVLAAPGLSDAALRHPGDYLLLKVEAPTSVEIHIAASEPGGSIQAEFEMELIAPAVRPARRQPAAAPARPAAAAADARGLALLAHVSRRGDVAFGADEWVCGPDLPMVIEGLEVRWPDKPADVTLTYAVTVGRQRQALRECGAGEFAGTRGKAAPVVGLALRLSGPGAERFELKVESLFLGSAVKADRGREITLAGPSGREPLVGLKLAVEPARAAAALAPARPSAPGPRGRRPQRPVQIFRSSAPVAAAS